MTSQPLIPLGQRTPKSRCNWQEAVFSNHQTQPILTTTPINHLRQETRTVRVAMSRTTSPQTNCCCNSGMTLSRKRMRKSHLWGASFRSPHPRTTHSMTNLKMSERTCPYWPNSLIHLPMLNQWQPAMSMMTRTRKSTRSLKDSKSSSWITQTHWTGVNGT